VPGVTVLSHLWADQHPHASIYLGLTCASGSTSEAHEVFEAVEEERKSILIAGPHRLQSLPKWRRRNHLGDLLSGSASQVALLYRWEVLRRSRLCSNNHL